MLLSPTPQGLYCAEGDFFIDPTRPVARAVITHGHADHARAGHGAVLATAETLAIMAVRYGERFAGSTQALRLGDSVRLGGTLVRLVPAGHVLGSAQAVVESGGQRFVVSGDYKRRADPTCPAFEPVPCDVFITEATFGLPVFLHPEDRDEIGKLLRSLSVFPDRAHLVGAYSLGKAQRAIALLRQAGYEAPLFLHGAMGPLCALYEQLGIRLGPLKPVLGSTKEELKGAIVLAPPSALKDLWSRRLPDPVTCFASGWMRIRARARQSQVEVPLILSDHADWGELTRTIQEVAQGEIWVTHGQEDALVHWASTQGLCARALSMVGYDDAGEGPSGPEATP